MESGEYGGARLPRSYPLMTVKYVDVPSSAQLVSLPCSFDLRLNRNTCLWYSGSHVRCPPLDFLRRRFPDLVFTGS